MRKKKKIEKKIDMYTWLDHHGSRDVSDLREDEFGFYVEMGVIGGAVKRVYPQVLINHVDKLLIRGLIEKLSTKQPSLSPKLSPEKRELSTA